MPRGGFRAAAGRKPDPTSKRQQALAKRAAKLQAAPEKRGFTAPNGEKAADAPPNWPFGTTAPAPEQVPAEPKLTFESPLEYWQHVLADPEASKSDKHSAAFAMAPYVHPKMAPAAKKEAAKTRAGVAAKGKFAAAAPPLKLVRR